MSRKKVIIVSLVISVLILLFIGTKIYVDNHPQPSENDSISLHRHLPTNCEYCATYNQEQELPVSYKITQVEFSEDFEIWPKEEIPIYEYDCFHSEYELVQILNKYFDIYLIQNNYSYEEEKTVGNYQFNSAPNNNEKNSTYTFTCNHYSGKFAFVNLRSPKELKRFYKEYRQADLSAPYPQMEQIAQEFANNFTPILGQLTLDYSEPFEIYESFFNTDDSYSFYEYNYQGYIFHFNLSEETKLPIFEGYEGSIYYANKNKSYFNVYIRPDGTIYRVDNLLSRASCIPCDSRGPLDKHYLEKCAQIFTSPYENDTIVFTAIQSVDYKNDFYERITTPILTVEYYYKSNPKKLMRSCLIYDPSRFEL